MESSLRSRARIRSVSFGCVPWEMCIRDRDLDASEIDVRLGATWIDADYIQQFMEETFETPYYLRRSIEVKFLSLIHI